MILLHASYSNDGDEAGLLFLWGEYVGQSDRKRLKSATNASATLLDHDELDTVFDNILPTFQSRRDKQTLYLPDDRTSSGEVSLYPVHADVIWIDHDALFHLQDLLNSPSISEFTFNLDSETVVSIGPSIRFWIKVMDWTEKLIEREQIVPTIAPEDSFGNTKFYAGWRPALTPQVTEDLATFERSMPLICCTPLLRTRISNFGGEIDLSDEQIVSDAVQLALYPFIDKVMTSIIDKALAGRSPLPYRHQPPIIFNFVGHLFDMGRPLDNSMSKQSVRKLRDAVEAWSVDIASSNEPTATAVPSPVSGTKPRLVLRLIPAGMDDETSHVDHHAWTVVEDWVLEYWVKDGDNAPYPIERLWDSQDPVDSFKRTFCLRTLAWITRHFPEIRPSLKMIPPTPSPIGLDGVRWLLDEEVQSHFEEKGVITEIPRQLDVATKKPNITLTVRPATDGLFNLQSLVNFEWRATIDGIDIDESTFRSLVEHHTPLLRYRNQWIELDPAVIRGLQRLRDEEAPHNTASIADIVAVVEDVEEDLNTTITLEPSPTADGKSFQRIWNTFKGDLDWERVDAPKGLRSSLRPYQLRGVAWMTLMGEMGLGACLADDMGLGKTVQVIAYLLRLKEQGLLTRPSIVIGPMAVVANWHREIIRFAPDLTAIIHHGSDRASGDDLLRQLAAPDRPDVLITSYGTAQRDAEALRQLEWQAIIADEAQNIKNPVAKNTRMIKSLRAEQRIALTGTPIENHLQELWSIMDFLNPDYLGSVESFRNTFARPIEKEGDPFASKRLKYVVRPFILRRTKEDAAIAPDLPEKQESKLYCTLTPKQASLYQGVVDKMIAQIESADGMHRRGLVFSALTQLKQICNHPALVLKEPTADPQDSGKLQLLIDRIKNDVNPDEKALIFTQYTHMGQLLQNVLHEQLEDDVLFYHGSLSRPVREDVIERFQSQRGPRLLVLSLRAGGVGINLTRATHVFHYDRWWNPAVENQATDRAYRIGQTNEVHVHTLVCRGTLEDHIDSMIEKKRWLANEIIESGEQWITELTTDELTDLFSLKETVAS